jgi:hypothetical protein
VPPDGENEQDRQDCLDGEGSIRQTEYDLRSWVLAVHPDTVGDMLGQSAGIWECTEASGNLHMAYLDEYLANPGS